MKNATRFELYQVIPDTRSGDDQLHAYSTYGSLADAKAAAKKELSGCQWQIYSSTLVASGDNRVKVSRGVKA